MISSKLLLMTYVDSGSELFPRKFLKNTHKLRLHESSTDDTVMGSFSSKCSVHWLNNNQFFVLICVEHLYLIL